MANVQKQYFVFRRNGRVHLNRPGASDKLITGSRVVRISGSNAGYTMFRGSVKGSGYSLHPPISPSLPFPCVIVCYKFSPGLYTMNASGGLELQPHTFLIWILDGNEWSVSKASSFKPRMRNSGIFPVCTRGWGWGKSAWGW